MEWNDTQILCLTWKQKIYNEKKLYSSRTVTEQEIYITSIVAE